MYREGEIAALTSRVEDALREAGVGIDQSKVTAATLLSNEVFGGIAAQSILLPTTDFLDFKGKIHDLVGRFTEAGLTVERYLPAALKQPSLFGRSPGAIEANIRGLVARFASDGLTVERYVAAALKQPSLFCQSPATIEANIRGLVGRFTEAGLTVEKYLPAALKQPSLFCQSPGAIEANIRGLVAQFAGDGLTVEKYVAAALKQPSLFGQSPATIEANIRGLVGRFAEAGLTVEKYLPAVLKQPSLFYQLPATIAGHIHQIADVYDRGLLRFRGRRAAGVAPLTSVLEFLCANPKLLSLASGNLELRDYVACLAEEPSLAVTLYQKARGRTEGEVARRLGHADLREPVPPAELPEDGASTDASANRWVLRALIHAGVIKSGALKDKGPQKS